MKTTFLKAEWRKLLMANYEVNPEVLKPYLPHKTELDLWNNTCYVSLIGFMFLNTKVLGIKVPFHTNFEEVNLRFYVKYNDNGNHKRGVVFIKEIVPKPALTLVANGLYKEHYQTLKMDHKWQSDQDSQSVSYRWKKNNKWNSIQVNASSEPEKIEENSEAEFITEHYWGYTKISDRKTSEYEVMHPKWDVYKVYDYMSEVDFESVYGKDFSFLNNAKPKSVFLAEGSEIKVKKGIQL